MTKTKKPKQKNINYETNFFTEKYPFLNIRCIEDSKGFITYKWDCWCLSKSTITKEYKIEEWGSEFQMTTNPVQDGESGFEEMFVEKGKTREDFVFSPVREPLDTHEG